MGNQQSSPFSQPPINSDTADAANPNTSPLCGVECQKQRQLAAAQQAYQTALANKDNDPTTYQLMRYRYYSLKEGPSWAQQEKARIAQNDINPVVDKLRQTYQQVNSQFMSQRDLVDAVDTLQQQQESLRNQSEQQLKLLEGDLEEKKAKIGVYNRSVEFASERPSFLRTTTLDPLIRYFSDYPATFQTILDVTIGIVIFLAFILFMSRARAVAERFKFPGATPPPTETVQKTVQATTGNISKAFGAVKEAVSGYGLIIGLSAVLIALSLVIVYEGNKL